MVDLIHSPMTPMLVRPTSSVVQVVQKMPHAREGIRCGHYSLTDFCRNVKHIVVLFAHCTENAIAAVNSFSNVVPRVTARVPKGVDWTAMHANSKMEFNRQPFVGDQHFNQVG